MFEPDDLLLALSFPTTRPTRFNSPKEHLRAMKRAAGRPQDIEDLGRLGVD